MSEKKKFTLYAGSVALCVCTAVLLHYVLVADPYLESACRLLRPFISVSYTHLRAHETDSYLVCRLLLEKKKNQN